ncbi:HAD-IA family hydrolase [Ligilactobacillus cholophilus]|uniref:HAD-IA family hydrolase n=1 Tax=Ligilactobacillus cholophilus TaxID=3050131 RepID=UPI0025B205A1|nr:HAD-IA family hydrolase [Ligilactobacillus cholophilus]
MYREFFWDFDGTLFDTYPGMVKAFITVFKDENIDLDESAVYKRMRQTSLGQTFKYYCDQNGLQDPKKMRELYNPVEEKLEENMHPFVGVKDVLERVVDEGGHNYLMTHRNQSSLEMLDGFDLKKYFKDAVTAEKSFPRKPNPASLNSLVEKYELNPENCVMVGDRVLDIEAAHNAKMSGILFDPDDLIVEPVEPEHRIHQISDIIKWID